MKMPVGSYVYSLTVNGVVRYIGKGTKWRAWGHQRKARAVIRQRALGEMVKSSGVTHRLIAAMKAGEDITVTIIRDGLDCEAAYDLEASEWARHDHLWNARPGGRGGHVIGSREMWQRPGHREKVRPLMKAAFQRPEVKAKLKAAGAERFATDQTVKDALAAGRTPGARKKQGASLAKHLASDAGQKHKEALRKSITPEVIARRAETLRQRCQTPEGKARMKAMREARWGKQEA